MRFVIDTVGYDADPAVTVCINEQWVPYIVGALEVLTIPDYWGDNAVVVLEIERLIGDLCKPATGCAAAPGRHADFLSGNGQPACGPTAVAVSFGSCTGSYNSGPDRFDSCDDGDFQSLAVEVDLTGVSSFTCRRVQVRLHFNSTRADPFGGPCTQRIVVAGTTYASFNVANTFTGEDSILLDTGIIDEVSPLIRIETFVRDTVGTSTAFAYIEAIAIEGVGTDPWAC